MSLIHWVETPSSAFTWKVVLCIFFCIDSGLGANKITSISVDVSLATRQLKKL